MREKTDMLRRSLVKPHNLSFPQAERVGNRSENKERFRSSRNDRIAGNVALFTNSFVTPRGLSRQIFLISIFSVYLCLCLCLFSSVHPAAAATVGRIDIVGLNSIDREEMLDMLGFREGGSVDAEIIRTAIKRAFRKGIFDNIFIETSDGVPSVVTVQVKKKDMIRKVSVQGTYPLSAGKVRELLLMKEGDVMRYDLIDQTAAALKNSFVDIGFPEAKIDISASRDEKRYNSITLIVSIEAGPAQVIKGVRIIGTDIVDAGDIRLSANDIYDQSRLRTELKRIREQLKKDGYFKPVIGSHSFENGILAIPIDPGKKLVTVFDGNSAVSVKRLEKELPFFDGEVFNDGAVDEAVSRMLALYHTEGYSLAQIAPVVRSDQRQILVTFFVYEGRQVKVRTIRFTGAALSPQILQSVLELKEGGPYNPDLIQRDRDTLGEYYAALGYLEA
ncbi:MAG: POTRA domain-containing protein, partial [Nitrospirota bacterium]|nr:POTRA domain-containing protein [Nitrospirota bacterium]